MRKFQYFRGEIAGESSKGKKERKISGKGICVKRFESNRAAEL